MPEFVVNDKGAFCYEASETFWKNTSKFIPNMNKVFDSLKSTHSIECDVLIVGGGYSGLSNAYFLSQANPGLRIILVEAKFCGYGASGRNRFQSRSHYFFVLILIFLVDFLI